MSEPISSLPLFAPQPTPDDLADAWPDLDTAIRVRCETCADMGARIVWADDGVPVVEKCPACAAGDSEEEL